MSSKIGRAISKSGTPIDGCFGMVSNVFKVHPPGFQALSHGFLSVGAVLAARASVLSMCIMPSIGIPVIVAIASRTDEWLTSLPVNSRSFFDSARVCA